MTPRPESPKATDHSVLSGVSSRPLEIVTPTSNFNYENIWLADQIHLNPENHANLFMKKILEELSKYLQ